MPYGRRRGILVELPPVEEEARRRVEEVLHVQQELALAFFDVVRAVEEEADLDQGQDRHHQRVVPELVRVGAQVGHVLHAAVGGAREVVHGPFRPRVQPGEVGWVAGLFVEVREGQEGGHCVDVFGGAFEEAVVEPGVHDVEGGRGACLLVVLEEAVEADAVRPFPVVPAFGVDDAAIGEFEKEVP